MYVRAAILTPAMSFRSLPGERLRPAVSYLHLPPYLGMRERFGAGVLPDPVTNSPMIGARNPFGALGY